MDCSKRDEEDSSSDSDVKHAPNSRYNPPHYNSTTTKATTAATSNNDAKALLISASDKAGMQNIDRNRINAILLRESGDSAFIRRQRELDDKSEARIRDMKKRLRDKDSVVTSDGYDWRKALIRSTIDPLLQSYRKKRRRRSTCAVIDMDGFFISCHTLIDPTLADVPACVGGTSMISTSNYIARRYGVRAAMPGYLGSALVKELSNGTETLTFVKSDYELYKQKSAEVKTVLERYDPNLKMRSLDEAYMDIGPYLEGQWKLSDDDKSLDDNENAPLARQCSEENSDQTTASCLDSEQYHAAAQNLLHSIRQNVKDATGLTCSAGLASNFLIAKVASDVNKPNGQCFIGPSEEEIQNFVRPLACRKINGIGRVMEKTLLGSLGIETVHDLYEKRAEVYHLFQPATAQFLMRVSIGYSDSGASDETNEDDDSEDRKGISHERTFSPVSDWTDLCTRVETITHMLIRDLKERNLRPRTTTLKVKLANFNVLSKSASREVAFFQPGNMQQSSLDLVNTVLKLLKEAKSSYTSSHNNDSFSVRLLGVRCSNFQTAKDNQMSLDRYCGKSMSPSAAVQPFDNRIQSTTSNNSPVIVNPYKTSPKRSKGSTSPTYNTALKSTLPNGSDDITADSAKIVQCPICGLSLQNSDDSAINTHIDSCLNASTVKQLAKEETMFADAKDEKSKKKRSLADYFNSS